MIDIVRTRFAPSPTGYLHIGGARTALFCYLLAKRLGGKFVVRIEDTDQSRNVAEATTQILEDLHWLGLNWDEGPNIGGEYGPYYQSQRLDLYREHAQRLLDSGHAYYAFETREELDAMRAEARDRSEKGFRYPRPESFPSKADAQQAHAEGRPVVVRFKMPEHNFVINDQILGKVTIDASELSDFVIVKADGWPTYHFAVVIDDALMKITHVLRGQEHLMNTPNHLALFEAFGYTPPQFTHLPIIFNMQGAKMSKREKNHKSPEIDIHDFRKSGYLPEVLVNFIALLGWNPGDDRETFTLPELCETFSIERIGKTNARFDRDKLLSFNTTGIAAADEARKLAAFRDYLAVNESGPLTNLGDAMLAHLMTLCAGFRTFPDIEAKCGALFAADDALTYDPAAVKKWLTKGEGAGLKVLTELRERLAALTDWQPADLDSLVRTYAEEKGFGLGKVAMPLRVAITGSTISPAIDKTLMLLGHDSTLTRINFCLNFPLDNLD